MRVRHFGLFATAHVQRLRIAQELLEAGNASDLESKSTDRQDDSVEEQCPACMFGRLIRDEADPDQSQEDLWDP